MEVLKEFQANVLEAVSNDFQRFLHDQLPWGQRMIAIKGLRGAGKTTLILQHIKYVEKDQRTSLYITADHPWFYTNTLFVLADTFYKDGGRSLYIDEVHKYANWSRELKNIYDGYPKMKIVFTASSALNIYRGESDLSRRVLTFNFPGMSFREYLELVHHIKLNPVSFADILNNHTAIATEILKQFETPLPVFKQYLVNGYLPLIHGDTESNYLTKIMQVIDNSISNDLAFIENYSASHAVKIKKLLGVVAESAPFEPNISSIAQKLQLGRDTVNNFLQHLQSAHLLNLINRPTEGIAALQKPDKIYLENTNLIYALKAAPETGTIRETFLLNQLKNAGHKIQLAVKGDFLVNNKYTFEVGGKSKSGKQINEIKNSFIAADEITIGHGNRIPLWLFGLMY